MNWEHLNELRSLSDKGRDEEALSELRVLLGGSAAPEERAAVLVTIAVPLKNLGRFSDAREVIAEARNLVRTNSETYAWILLGDAGLDVNEGKWKDALKKFDAILSGFPALFQKPENRETLDDIQRKRGVALAGLDRCDEARPLLERTASQDHDEQGLVLYCLGKCYYKSGAYEKARQSLRQALSVHLDPDYQVDARYHLGLTYYRLHQTAWAIQEFERCLEGDAGSGVPRDYILKAKALAEQERTS